MPPAEAMPASASVAEALQELARDKEVALAMIDQAGEEALANQEVATPWEPGRPRLLGRQLLLMVGHLAQHKAQLFYYLKLMGKEVDTMHLWGV